MTIISIHSFRGGAGKSSTAASLASIMATMGKRVGIVDMDIQTPSLQVIFGLKEPSPTLNDYLWEKVKIEKVAYDVTDNLGSNIPGKLFLIPASLRPRDITKVLRESFDPTLVNEAFKKLCTRLELDVLLVDTHAGINEETVLTITVSDTVLVVMRPDQLDYLGSEMSVEMTRRLNVENVLIVINQVPQSLDPAVLKQKVEDQYHCPVVEIISYAEELALLSSTAIFALRHPEHDITKCYQHLAKVLLS